MASANEDSILGRVQAMLDRANHPDTNEHEREVCLRKADQMMQAHKLTEAALRARNAAKGFAEEQRHKPTDIKVDWISPLDEFYPVHVRIVMALMQLTEVQIVFVGSKIHLFGMPDDVDYFRMSWLSAHLTFSSKLYPRWNLGATAGANIRAFVEAGYKWNYIYNKALEEGQPFTRKDGTLVSPPPGDNGWMKRELDKAYKATGEEKPKLSHAVKNYRDSYAAGFQETFVERVMEMILARMKAARDAEGGAQLVLVSDHDAVTKLKDSVYPPEMLQSGRPLANISGTHQGAIANGRASARSVDMTGGKGGVGRTVRGEL